ncbi:hypothetical protein EVB94_274 [Rhizobium phage RHph_TM40]|uniref:Uncharacterized protein n=2 Tax=Cuauhnahuacvirus TaxID=3044696 RepID=A0A7S5R8A2_9CAUD|nr:hypothetical protein PQC16_gp274 [Rhizobium phage RHph_TM30]YP_010671423.1 hypothetical protein PQC17_gp274 [Rhizobium phage RHph_Y65]QIG71745.1 hypothetical protein EVB94_274 [Rhizobium phage RHph_TM40]QIG72107.1 hypothetical protein EVB95_273 [Rhizobium phage RHph_TM2_3B]QIG72469.1 hypothetical protein EVB96_273 [Rhizobium phage RHph_TM3_3_6]QIG71381.1 hypothetical protein EVB93_274 [Rhizobium phage RHph_TM30]QIG72832.1 hypothetical protein EVB97_274 [Rhizobium phage RHph_Y65]
MLVYSYILYGWAQSTITGGDGSSAKRLTLIRKLNQEFNLLPDSLRGKGGKNDFDTARALTTYLCQMLKVPPIKFPDPASSIKSMDQAVLVSDKLSIDVINKGSPVYFTMSKVMQTIQSSGTDAHRAYFLSAIINMMLAGSRMFFTLAASQGSYNYDESTAITSYINRFTKMKISTFGKSMTFMELNFTSMTEQFNNCYRALVRDYPNLQISDPNALIASIRQNIILYRMQEIK